MYIQSFLRVKKDEERSFNIDCLFLQYLLRFSIPANVNKYRLRVNNWSHVTCLVAMGEVNRILIYLFIYLYFT